ncbi:MAG TPA: histidine kinase [Dehalococcoidia bacterium]|nr:histidine kinase [Dehalococcoidia bacterium]
MNGVRVLTRDRALTGLVALVILAAALEVLLVRGVLPLAIVLAAGCLIVRWLSTGLARLVARVQVSLQWKIVAVLILMALLFISVSVINFEAMDYMHTELHDIIGGPQRDAGGMLLAVERLERTQHGFLFTFAPMLAMLGAVIAIALGAAIAISVIEPLQRMKQAMRRIAAGELSQRVEVRNRDELGELAEHINQMARELARLQETALAEERTRALRERIVQVTAAQEDERRRISRELHDGLGQSLAATVNRLRACQELVRRDPAAAERELAEMGRSLAGNIQEIRALIHALRPLAIDQVGLVGAMRQQIEQFASTTGITVLSLLSPVAVEPLAEVTLFRVLQECLGNVQRHAGASEAEVRLRDADNEVELVVRDNGRGFDTRGHGGGAGGVGLVGMRERAELIGGRLHVRSSRGNGCEVRLVVPHRAAEATREAAVGSDPRPAG